MSRNQWSTCRRLSFFREADVLFIRFDQRCVFCHADDASNIPPTQVAHALRDELQSE